MSRADGNGWTLACADSLLWLHAAETESVDAVVTDPPYSSGGQHRGDRTAATSAKYQNSDSAIEYPEFNGDTRDQRGYLAWCSLWLAEAWRITKPGGVGIVFTDWRMLPTATDAFQAGGWVWRGIVPWTKPGARPHLGRFTASCEFAIWGSKGPMPNDRGVGVLPGFIEAIPVRSDVRQHLTEKPESVMRKLVQIVPAGGLICDPFAGSGTTGVAALLEDRRFVGVEMSAEYHRIACDRLRALENLEHRRDAERGQAGLFTTEPKR